MTPEEAKQLILIHAGMCDSPLAATAFIGSLRPFTGIREENFHQIMEALQILTPYLQQEQIDRELICALWSLCELTRAWGVDTSGMLVRNNLLSDSDKVSLKKWIDTISSAVLLILEKGSIEKSMNYTPPNK